MAGLGFKSKFGVEMYEFKNDNTLKFEFWDCQLKDTIANFEQGIRYIQSNSRINSRTMLDLGYCGNTEQTNNSLGKWMDGVCPECDTSVEI